MKKIIALVATLVLTLGCVFGLVGCGNNAKGATVGAQAGTTGYFFANSIKNVNAKGYDTPDLAVQDMINGVVDYVVVDKSVAEDLVDSNDQIKLIDIELTKDVYAIGVDKAQETLKNQINEILTNKKETIDAILAKDLNEFIPITSAVKDASKASQQLVIATNAEFSPYEYMDGSSYKGCDMEIAKLIADELNMELVIDNMDFDAVVNAVGKNNIDIAIAALSMTAERAESVNFTIGYQASEGQVILALKTNTKIDSALTALDVINIFMSK